MQTRKFEGKYYKTQQPNVQEVDICATQNVSGKEGKKDKGISCRIQETGRMWATVKSQIYQTGKKKRLPLTPFQLIPFYFIIQNFREKTKKQNKIVNYGVMAGKAKN